MSKRLHLYFTERNYIAFFANKSFYIRYRFPVIYFEVIKKLILWQIKTVQIQLIENRKQSDWKLERIHLRLALGNIHLRTFTFFTTHLCIKTQLNNAQLVYLYFFKFNLIAFWSLILLICCYNIFFYNLFNIPINLCIFYIII